MYKNVKNFNRVVLIHKQIVFACKLCDRLPIIFFWNFLLISYILRVM